MGSQGLRWRCVFRAVFVLDVPRAAELESVATAHRVVCAALIFTIMNLFPDGPLPGDFVVVGRELTIQGQG